MFNSKTSIAISPGATIKEQLENRGIIQKEFAMRMGISEKHISQLLNGKVELTYNMSLRLESVLGIPASFWNNLETIYRNQIALVQLELDMEEDSLIAAKFPYAKLASLGWVPATKKITEKVKNLRSFFEVAKLDIISNLKIPGIAFRINGENENSDYALAAWAQKARLEARKQETASININRLNKNIVKIRKLTVLEPEQFCSELTQFLSDCGVAIVFLPHIDGSFLHGASFVDGKKIVLGLTVRGRYADKFWFSLFHELYHIIEGHINNIGLTTEEEEKAADIFARDILISPEDYELFSNNFNFTKNDIIEFAERINIDPGIVLGRLQIEHLVRFNQYNDLKTKYVINL